MKLKLNLMRDTLRKEHIDHPGVSSEVARIRDPMSRKSIRLAE